VSTAGEISHVKDATIERPKDQAPLESQVQTQPAEVQVQSEPAVQTQTQPVDQVPSESQTESKPKRKRPRIAIQEIPAVPDKSVVQANPAATESIQSE
jgi:hypothetical protein